MTVTEANPYAQIKAYERGEFDRLSRYLEGLDADGWVEQSYCTDWLVYQVVSHVGSGSRIGRMRLESWVTGGPPATREVMQGVWGLFDSLRPEQMLSAYAAAAQEYLAAEAATPNDAGLLEVDGFVQLALVVQRGRGVMRFDLSAGLDDGPDAHRARHARRRAHGSNRLVRRGPRIVEANGAQPGERAQRGGDG